MVTANCAQEFFRRLDGAIVERSPEPDGAATRSKLMRSDRSKMQPSKKTAKISSAADLAKTSKSGDIELDDKELEEVSGGKHVANIKWTPGTTTR
jgi:bacteriocin-like protein